MNINYECFINQDTSYIEKSAKIVKDALNLNSPINLNYLINTINLLGGNFTIIEKNNEYVESYTTFYKKDNEIKFEIICKNSSEKRLIFLILHELGHLFLNMVSSDEIKEKNEYNSKYLNKYDDWAANQFAAEILMPKKEFIDYCYKTCNNNIVNIKNVANYFNVNKQAVKIRGLNLGLLKR